MGPQVARWGAQDLCKVGSLNKYPPPVSDWVAGSIFLFRGILEIVSDRFASGFPECEVVFTGAETAINPLTGHPPRFCTVVPLLSEKELIKDWDAYEQASGIGADIAGAHFFECLGMEAKTTLNTAGEPWNSWIQ